MPHLGEVMLDAVLLATPVEHVHRVACRRSIGVALWKVNRMPLSDMDLVRDGCDQSLEEGGRRGSASLPHDLHEGEFADTIDGDVEIQLTFGRLSAAIDRRASTTFLNDVPRSLRRTNSLFVPVSISSRRLAFFRLAAAFFLAAMCRLRRRSVR